MDDMEFTQFAEAVNGFVGEDEINSENDTKEVDMKEVKHETPVDYGDKIKCSFCPENVPTTEIVLHTQMHVLEWEKEGDPDLDGSDTDTDDKEPKSKAKKGKDKENAHNLPDSELMNCSLCQKKVPKATIYDHTHEHMFAKRKMHPCHLCDKTYRDKNQLRLHLMVHTGEKPFQCDRCDKTFRLAQSLKNHININHTKANLETCDQCGEAFTYKKGLIGHLSKVHGIETGWKCEKCGERFLTENGMRSHEKVDSCYKLCCPDCGKMFKRASLLEKHREVHMDKEHTHHCDQCGKDFPSTEALKRHTLLHLNLRQFQCFCGKAFNRKDGLRAHEKTHGHKNPKYDVREKDVYQVLSVGHDQREATLREQEQERLHWLYNTQNQGLKSEFATWGQR